MIVKRSSLPNPPAPGTPDTIGWLDTPFGAAIGDGERIRFAGWALSIHGIRAIEIRFADRTQVARYGMPRPDVAAVYPGYPARAYCGFEATVRALGPLPNLVARGAVRVIAIAGDGSETTLGRLALVNPAAHERWSFLAKRPARPFFLLPATSGVSAGGANELERAYAAYVSPTTKIGMRVPILYLRTTTGVAGDYRFDPDFDVRRRNGARAVADDALAPVLTHSAQHRLPVLVTLNGGIWADASGTCPAWDVNDRLEEDVANCQWNERNEVMPDDHLSHLPGSQKAPELARALTLNVYARAVRHYKRRNLQAAAAHLAGFMRAHPDLVVGVNLDPDVYINPFFSGSQWYDYNPGTLRQFRHWLAGSGPYAGACEADVPDLSSYRRRHPLTLDEVCAVAQRRFASFEAVDPPRRFVHGTDHPHWKDPWVTEWEVFRRHLVRLHYDELARWVCDAGIPRGCIWSSQGLDAPSDLHAPPEGFMPLALRESSAPRNFDSGGVCIEGSKPRDGHLGAIVYGAAATNDVPMENGRSLYATLASVDADFGIVEFNTADFRHPERQPTYASAYRALRALWNQGARFVSPMAWNGSNGAHAHDAEYVTFTAWRNTPLEEAACDFLLERAGLPAGSRLWTFGTPVHADDDGWTLDAGSMRALPGGLALTADRRGRVTLVSPPEVALRCGDIDAVVAGLPGDVAPEAIRIDARGANGARWQQLVDARASSLACTAAGRVIAIPRITRAIDVDQLRMTIRVAPCAQFTLERVAILRRT
ncbi:MAG TPA: hypothetical protein VFO53_01720 [Casimicrobiaceae bacterium]|nr:hypothetical protein [Casimicrobiaceae bacterium]